jgi:DHA2 family multidrug resistance protein-like MFS transporter
MTNATTTEDPAADPPPRAGRRTWLGLAVLILPTLLVAVDINAVFLAMPKLSVDLGATGTQQLWIADGYGFMVAGFVISMGSLGDRIGRRRMLMTAGAAFGALSVLAAYSTSPEMLIVARLLLGVAGASLMPSTLALIITMFVDARQRAFAVTIWSTTMFGGAAIGPVLGGVLLDHFWWGSVFLIAAPTIAVMLVLAPMTLPETGDPTAGRPDVHSVALCLATILPTAWAVKQLGTTSADVVTVVLAVVVGLGCGVLFVRRQRGLASPMLRLELLRDSRVATILLAMVVTGSGLTALGWVTTQYLQSVVGLTPVAAAATFAPMGLTLAAGCMLSPLVTRRHPPAVVIPAGLAVSTIGFLPTVFVHGTIALVLTDSLVAFGTGPLFALGTGLVVGSVPAERAGSAAALAEVCNYLGGTVGITVFGTIAAAVYQTRLHDAPPEARESVAGATDTARALPPDAAHQLLDAAHGAFGSAITVIAVAGLAVFAVLTLVCRRAASP